MCSGSRDHQSLGSDRAWVRRLAMVAAVVCFTVGAVVAAARPAEAGRPRILMIGDSTLAALAWYPGSQAGFEGLDYVLDAQSCRAVTAPSCVGRVDRRTGRRIRPANALSVLQSHRRGSFDELVLMVGYDEAYSAFRTSVDVITQAARDRGIDHITWLTFRTDVSYVPPLGAARDHSYRSNNSLLADAAHRSGGFISLLDWNSYVNGRSGLVERDGVHLTAAGASAAARLIRDAVVSHWGTGTGSTGGSGSDAPERPTNAPAPRTDLPTWRYGTVGESVKELQRLLIAVGADELEQHGLTGRYFAVTERAVRAFQDRVRRRNDATMIVDGVVGPATWAWLVKISGLEPQMNRQPRSTGSTGGSAPSGSGAGTGRLAPRTDLPTWSYGTIGEPVKDLQRLLIAAGADELEQHGLSGRYYAVTRRAVREFQELVRVRHDSTMVVDGVVGPLTWAWLLHLTGAPDPASV
jgi:peptidoglycan hydrolase-like protein with peptidoglycan-binding domain